MMNEQSHLIDVMNVIMYNTYAIVEEINTVLAENYGLKADL